MDDNERLSDSEQEIAAMVRAVGAERVDWVPPPAGLWSRIEADLGQPVDGTARGPVPGASAEVVTPRPSRRTLLAAVGGGIVAGVALGALGRGLLDSGDRQTVLTADLRTLTTDQRLGRAVLRQQDGALFLEILASEPIEFTAGIVEVWLIHIDGQRMVSIGVYGDGESTRYPVPRTLVDQGYRLVDLSREPLDGDNNHSGDSIVRGELH